MARAAPRRVLFVAHNHPSSRPGGAEVYSHELYTALRARTDFEPFLVAKTGPPFSADEPHGESSFGLISSDQNEYSLYTDGSRFDRLFGTYREKTLYTDEWPAFLRAISPDVVHFQHTLYLGYDMLRATRRTLPGAPIVYTLHEFLPICHHSGQMVRTGTFEPCDHATPGRCHGCFPKTPMHTFFLRERFVKAAFELVDMFITPSEHARERYISWGIPPEKIRHEDYGRVSQSPSADTPDAGHRARFAFIGQMTPFKGVEVLLEAMRVLAARGVKAELLLHGGNLEHQPPWFRERIEELLRQTAENVRFVGSYEQSQLPAMLAEVDWIVVPSIWWETGPLVIHEALMYNRPVICSDMGSMLERVSDGVNGLHFKTGDPDSLADAMQRAAGSPMLWERTRAALGNPHPMEDHLRVITGIYDELLDHTTHARAA